MSTTAKLRLTRRVAWLMALVALCAAAQAIVGAKPAAATPGTDDYPYKNNAWCATWTGMNNTPPTTPDVNNCTSEYNDAWSFYKRECTSFVAWRLTNDNGFTTFNDTMTRTVNGVSVTRTLGSAGTWGSAARDLGYTVDMTPAIGSVAWWNTSQAQHVAWVHSVSGTSVTIEEYNWGLTHNYSNPLRVIAANSVSGYIHFADLHPSSQLAASQHQMLGDVNGDGRADAVVFYPSGTGLSGNWYVAPSTGSSFASASVWATGMGPDSTRQFLADVNGDGKADAVMYWASSGTYYVGISNGTSFNWPTQWSTGQISGSNNQMMGDVNGDGKADAVVYSAGSGTWYASLSNGSSFTGFSQWKTGHGVGSANQLLADVTGDGKADAVVFFDTTGYLGNWYVATSSGYGFGGSGTWATGNGSGSSKQMLADVTGDGAADAVPYFGGSNGWWYMAMSNGTTGFISPGLYANGYGINSSNQLIGDVTGDGKADAVVYEGGTLGNWWVAASNGYNVAFSSPVEWMSNFGIGS